MDHSVYGRTLLLTIVVYPEDMIRDRDHVVCAYSESVLAL